MDTESGSSQVAPGPLGLSRNAIILIAVLALLAAFGWWRSFDKSRELAAVRQAATAAQTELQAKLATTSQRLADTEKANGELDAVQAKLAAANSSLNDRLAVLGDREKEAAAIETTVKERTAALDALEAQMTDAGSKLNRRLMALGEREREQVDIDRALAALRANKSASEAEVAAIQSKINARLKVLGEREQSLAEAETEARDAAYRVEQLEARPPWSSRG